VRRAAALVLLAAWVPLCGASYTAHREVQAGNEALAAGDPKAAVDHYERAGKADPDEAAIPYNVGTARLAAGDLDGAVEALGAAAGEASAAPSGNTDPIRARAAFNLGNAHLARARGETARADLQAAVQAFRQAVAADPEDAAARRNLQIAATRLADLPPPQQKPQSQPDTSQKGAQQNPSQSAPSQADNRQGPNPQDAGKPSEGGKDASRAPSGKGAGQSDGKAGGKDEAKADEKADGNGAAAREGELPEDVTRALAALRRKEAAVMREALRRGMGEPEQVEPDW